jgi:signal transduction histidine kinase
MNQKNIFKVSIFIGFTLIIIIVSQIYWMFESIEERKEHLHQHLMVAVDDLSLQLSYDTLFIVNCNSISNLDDIAKNKMIKSIEDKLEAFNLKSDFVFAIFDKKNNQNLISNNNRLFELHEFVHSKNFGKIGSEFTYVFAIKLLDSYSYLYHSLWNWILIVGFSILLLLFGFYLLIMIVLNQKKLSVTKNDFINNMTHELKTPIATISAAGEMLLKENVIDNKEKAIKYLRIIVSENQRLRRLVERVLQIAIMDKQGLKLNMSKVDLHEIIHQSIETSKVLLQSKNGNLKVNLQAHTHYINCDETHIRNIISNLVENAIKYSDTPEIEIKTKDHDNTGILITISDNGRGINVKDQGRIFEKFFRVHNGDVHDVKGFGLGLYYVKEMILEHRGTIKVQSEINHGSSFEVFLPFTR